MENLLLTGTNFEGEMLDRNQLKNVKGGLYDYYTCYATCMAGFDYDSHDSEAIRRKTSGCDTGCS